MNRASKLAAVATILLFGGVQLPANAGTASVNDERFTSLKALAGEWTEVGGDGSVAVTYRLTGVGNQPRMKAEKAGQASTIAFKFTGGGNMVSDKDGHMHELDVAFIDADHVKASWHFREGGKETEVKVFDLVRKKA